MEKRPGKGLPPLRLELRDSQWPLEYTDHHRVVVRAMVVDGAGYFYFVQARRNDEFGDATVLETPGGGVEPGEGLTQALERELREELGARVDILGELGVVSDYYNLIHRHNINHYYLCAMSSLGQRHLTPEEREQFHLSTRKLSYEQAVAEYRRCAGTRLGRLIADREVPILHRAKQWLDGPG